MNKSTGSQPIGINLKFTLVFMVLILVPMICLGYLTSYITGNIIYDNTVQSIRKNLILLSANVESRFAQIVGISQTLNADVQLRNILMKDYSRLGVREKIADTMFLNENHIISSKMAGLDWTSYYYLYSKYEDLYTDFNDPFAQDQSQKIFNKYWNQVIPGVYNLYWLPTETQLFNSPMLVFGRSMNASVSNHYGKYFLFIDEAMLSDVYADMGYNAREQVMITAADGTVISHVRGGEIGVNLGDEMDLTELTFDNYLILDYQQEQSLVLAAPLMLEGWRMVTIVPTSMLFDRIAYIDRWIFATLAALSVMALSVTILVVKSMTNPIRRLQAKAKQVTGGDLDVSFDIRGTQEIVWLGRCMNDMLERIRQLIRTVKQESRRTTDAEIKAYRAQMTPHFLHNVLNNIKWIAISHGEDEIVEMITSLGILLERSMKAPFSLVTVESELEVLGSFIYLESHRYRDRFRVVMHVDPEVMPLYMPDMLLQPLLENAIFYGIHEQDMLLIEIAITLREERLVCTVSDNGPGMSREKIDALLGTASGDQSLGIPNTNRRVRLRFGQEYGLSIDSAPGAGCRVTVTLPVITSQTGEGEWALA